MTHVAVIGHGRTPEGKGWGTRIDLCDWVVRMWDCAWQPASDYGEKYTHGYFELSPKQLAWFNQFNVCIPSKLWVVGVIKMTEMELPDSPDCLLINPHEWIDLGVRLGGVGEYGKLKLTRGCTAACWAIGQLGRGDRLTLVGFDNVYSKAALTPEEGFSKIYREAPSTRPFKNYVGGGTKYYNHDYIAEGMIIETLAERSKIKLRHAQDIWT